MDIAVRQTEALDVDEDVVADFARGDDEGLRDIAELRVVPEYIVTFGVGACLGDDLGGQRGGEGDVDGAGQGDVFEQVRVLTRKDSPRRGGD